jgi:hypothetical protein
MSESLTKRARTDTTDESPPTDEPTDTDSSEEPATKRTCGDSEHKRITCIGADESSFSINITQPKTWETLVEIIQPILNDCQFRVIKTDEFSGLSIECIDSKSVCVVIAKLKGDVVINNNETKLDFCVPVDLLLAHLKSISPTNSATVYGDKNGEQLQFQITSASTGKRVRHFQLNTLNREFQEIDFSAIDYKYTVDFNLHELRKILRLASGRSVDCPEIRLRILEEIDKKDKYSSFFLIHIHSEQSYGEYCYQSIIEIDDSKECKSMTITTNDFDVEDGEVPILKMSQLTETFNEVFSVSYLHNFIKSLDGNNVVMKLSPSKPMVLTTSLGDEHSYVSFVLAHRRQDTVIDKITTFIDDR